MVGVDRNRGLPVALVLRVDVIPGGALVGEAASARRPCGGYRDEGQRCGERREG
jgi:hypothetical protein